MKETQKCREKKSSTRNDPAWREVLRILLWYYFTREHIYIRSREREMKLECLQFIHLLIHFPSPRQRARRGRASASVAWAGRRTQVKVHISTAASLHYVPFVISAALVKWPCFVCVEATGEKRGKQNSECERRERRQSYNNERERTIIFWQAVTYFPRFSGRSLRVRSFLLVNFFSSEITHATRLVRSSLAP